MDQTSTPDATFSTAGAYARLSPPMGDSPDRSNTP